MAQLKLLGILIRNDRGMGARRDIISSIDKALKCNTLDETRTIATFEHLLAGYDIFNPATHSCQYTDIPVAHAFSHMQMRDAAG